MNRNLPLFFFHIPKTAGSTMQSVLAEHYKMSEIAAAFTWTTLLELEPRVLPHMKLFQGHFYGPLEAIARTRLNTFTILRNPIERALSHYGHVYRDKSHYLHRRALELRTFDAYLEDPVTQKTVTNFQSRMLAMEFDVQGYYSKLTVDDKQQWRLEQEMETNDHDFGDDLLSQAQGKLDTFFLVGITERFTATLALLCGNLGWKYPETTIAQNTNILRPSQTQLASHTLKRLIDLNAIDLELYSGACTAFEKKIDNLLIDRANEQSPGGLLQRLFA